MDTEMLNMSERLRTQSLDENTLITIEKEEDKDSGTESDEEIILTPPCSCDTNTGSGSPQFVQKQAGPVLRMSSSSPIFTQLTHKLTEKHNTSDYEQCSLDSSTDCSVDYDPSTPAINADPLIQTRRLVPPMLHGFPSMDKISDCDSELADLLAGDSYLDDIDDNSYPAIDRCGSCGSVSGSDEEVHKLFDRKSPGPLRFRTSPPQGVHKLNKRTVSPKVFLASINTCSRFRHHHRYASGSMVQRPYLDFEKMQGMCTSTRMLYSII